MIKFKVFSFVTLILVVLLSLATGIFGYFLGEARSGLHVKDLEISTLKDQIFYLKSQVKLQNQRQGHHQQPSLYNESDQQQ